MMQPLTKTPRNVPMESIDLGINAEELNSNLQRSVGHQKSKLLTAVQTRCGQCGALKSMSEN